METPQTSETKITTTNTKKMKDPKRVEAGKRLAQISKAAKEKKMKERLQLEKGHDCGWGISNYHLIGVFGLIIASGSLYLNYKSYMAPKKDKPILVEQIVEHPLEQQKRYQKKNHLILCKW